MLGTINFIITSVAIGILIAIPTALIELWLVKTGVVRNRMLYLILGVFVLVFVKRIWLEELSWFWMAPMIVFFGIFGMNRGDFWTTMRKGRWWWKADK